MDNTIVTSMQCNGAPLRLDQACLTMDLVGPHPGQVGFVSYRVDSQTSECVNCNMDTIWKTGPNGTVTNYEVAVNTSWPTNLMVLQNDLEICSRIYHFEHLGRYNLSVVSTVADATDGVPDNCVVTMTQEPSNAFLPILWLFLLLAIIRPIFFALGCGWRNRHFRAFRRFAMALLFGRYESYSSLLDIDPLLPATEINQQRESEDDNIIQDPQQQSPHEVDEDEQTDQPLSQAELDRRAIIRAKKRYDQYHSARRAAIKPRFRFLDTFRGLTIALMIFVNYGGGGYWFFKHSVWNGLTLADIIFPMFMFIMGVSIPSVLYRRLNERVPKKKLIWDIGIRAFKLFFLGICLNSAHAHLGSGHLRIPGVLQRFGWAYFLAATVETLCMRGESLASPPMGAWYRVIHDLRHSGLQWLFTFAIVMTQLLLTFLVPYNGCPRGYLGPGGLHEHGDYANCTGGSARMLDAYFLTEAHLYQHPTCAKVYRTTMSYDPEGITGSFTSVFVVMLGLQAGRIIIAFRTHRGRFTRFMLWAVVLGLAGGALCGFSQEGGIIPVNKNLWSLSFGLVTASLSFAMLALIYLLSEWFPMWDGAPFTSAGMNPILLYVGHEILHGYFPFAWSPKHHNDSHAELLFMHAWGATLWMVIAYGLDRSRIYLRV